MAEFRHMTAQTSGEKAEEPLDVPMEGTELVVVPASVIAASESPVPLYAGQFNSRFNGWIRSVALAVICVFVPNQASWAFNYNPAILYGPRVAMVETSLALLPAERAAMLVSGSVSHLLNQVENKPASRIDLKVDDGVTKGSWFKPAKEFTLKIDSNVQFTKPQVDEIRRWLGNPSIHHLNCGVYALNDILAARGIQKTPEEVSVMTVTLDLMSGIVKPGDKTLKTSLYALTQVAKTFDLDYSAAKFKPENVLKIRPPFIAHLTGEHFVTVTGIEGDTVRIMDLGQAAVMPRADFIKKATGFVLAEGLDFFFQANFENVPASMQAFVWGDNWRERPLPGILTSGQTWSMVGIMVFVDAISVFVTAIAPPAGKLLGDGLSKFAQVALNVAVSVGVSMAAPQLAKLVSQAYYKACTSKGNNAGACAEKAMILNMALSTAFAFGLSAVASGASGTKIDWGKVGTEAL